MRLPILALALSLPAAAMAQEAMMNVTYACANDRTLQASFINAGDESFAVIFEAGALVPLQIAESASGARYLSADEGLELWTKGPEATLTLLGENETVLYRDCAEVPVEAMEEGSAG